MTNLRNHLNNKHVRTNARLLCRLATNDELGRWVYVMDQEDSRAFIGTLKCSYYYLAADGELELHQKAYLADSSVFTKWDFVYLPDIKDMPRCYYKDSSNTMALGYVIGERAGKYMVAGNLSDDNRYSLSLENPEDIAVISSDIMLPETREYEE